MAATALRALAVLACACSGGSGKAKEKLRATNADAASPTRALAVDWSMAIDGDELVIRYAVTNHTAEPVVLLDRLSVRGVVAPSAVVVADAAELDAVAFKRALVPRVNSVNPFVGQLPKARRLEAGAVASGVARVPLPLRGWHNFAASERIPPLHRASSAVLEIGYSRDLSILADRGWAARSKIRRSQKHARGETLPLPADIRWSADNAPELSWSLAIDGDRLRLDYRVTNDTGARIYLLDQLLVRGQVRPDAVIAVDDEIPNVIAFLRSSTTPPNVISEDPILPRARPVEVGETVTGEAFAPLPLVPWHNKVYRRSLPPLSPGARSAVFEVAYVVDTGEPPPSGPASEVSHRVLRGRVLELPAGVVIAP